MANRRRHYLGDTPRIFSLHLFAPLPRDLEREREYVLVHQYAEVPSPEPDGWLATIFTPGPRAARDSARFTALDDALRWARTAGVAQIVVERIEDRQLRMLPDPDQS